MELIKKIDVWNVRIVNDNNIVNKMSVEQGVKKFFRAKEDEKDAKCNELQQRMQWLIDNPGEHENHLAKFGRGQLSNYPNDCNSVDAFVRRHNEDHPTLQLVYQKTDSSISHVKTDVDHQRKTLKYTIY
uniref:Uncharacterized protein n=1 Tax=viral metagenome TaxID=1070528 RepID=A0A6C0C6V9_9ZZZZ